MLAIFENALLYHIDKDTTGNINVQRAIVLQHGGRKDMLCQTLENQQSCRSVLNKCIIPRVQNLDQYIKFYGVTYGQIINVTFICEFVLYEKEYYTRIIHLTHTQN